MRTLPSSRRDVMRALATLSVASVPTMAMASPGFVSIPASQDPKWLGLLSDERRAAAAFDQIVDVQEKAYDRFYDARTIAIEQWQQESEDRGGKPWKFINARPDAEQGEVRSQAGIRDYNAHCEKMRTEWDSMDARLAAETGLATVDEQYNLICDAHISSIKAILAFPSRDVEIIAHKLRLFLNRYGDDNGDIGSLLTSIDAGRV